MLHTYSESGFEWKGFRAGFAYDVHLTQQYKDHKNLGGPLPQGFEITLSYIGNIFTPKEDKLPLSIRDTKLLLN